jgi:hypothetical protein
MLAGKSLARAALLVAAGWVVCCMAGCGGGAPPTGEVHGKVMYKDKPVTAGIVKFVPEAGGEPVTTALGPNGTYRATEVPVGRSKVAIETLQFKKMAGPPKEIAKLIKPGGRPVYVPIPAKYEKPESSGLTVEVRKGENPFDIELQ